MNWYSWLWSVQWEEDSWQELEVWPRRVIEKVFHERRSWDLEVFGGRIEHNRENKVFMKPRMMKRWREGEERARELILLIITSVQREDLNSMLSVSFQSLTHPAHWPLTRSSGKKQSWLDVTMVAMCTAQPCVCTRSLRTFSSHPAKPMLEGYQLGRLMLAWSSAAIDTDLRVLERSPWLWSNGLWPRFTAVNVSFQFLRFQDFELCFSKEVSRDNGKGSDWLSPSRKTQSGGSTGAAFLGPALCLPWCTHPSSFGLSLTLDFFFLLK